MLLFLNTIERVELFTRDESRSVAVTEKTFSVGVADDCLEAVRNERERFVSQVRRSGDGAASAALPPEGFHCVTEVTMETKDHSQWPIVPQRETWLVYAFHAGQGDVSREMLAWRHLWGDGALSRARCTVSCPSLRACARRQDFRSTCTATSPSARTGVTSSGPRPTS